MIDPEKVSNVQKTNNKRDWEGRVENYADVTICTIAMPSWTGADNVPPRTS